MSRKWLSVCVVMLAGCASQNEPSVGMANPASVYCGKVGGQLEIQQTPSGEIGICVLPSGERIEEWTLFRRDHPEAKI
ncbi:DUF333 domain-containing protein [Bordetella tumulicola]|uniref:putative hemolysin n=1 Tax=Bordetella tumulicola TaxID=1649133 RepID=UPI0039EE8CB7